MILFNRVSKKLEPVFLEALDKRVGGNIIKPLFSHFGEDLYLLLSILEGTYKHFPSLKVLRSLLLQCQIYTLYIEKKNRKLEEDRIWDEISYEVGKSKKKVVELYDRFTEQHD